jgi:hypothetical protein
MSRAFEGFPITLLNMAVVEGVPIDWRAKELEATLLAKADEVRSAGGICVVTKQVPHGKRWYRSAEGKWSACEEAERTVEVEIGPHAAGVIFFCRWAADSLVVGERVAPVLCSLFRHLDAELDLGLGAIEPAPDLRP